MAPSHRELKLAHVVAICPCAPEWCGLRPCCMDGGSPECRTAWWPEGSQSCQMAEEGVPVRDRAERHF